MPEKRVNHATIRARLATEEVPPIVCPVSLDRLVLIETANPVVLMDLPNLMESALRVMPCVPRVDHPLGTVSPAPLPLCYKEASAYSAAM